MSMILIASSPNTPARKRVVIRDSPRVIRGRPPCPPGRFVDVGTRTANGNHRGTRPDEACASGTAAAPAMDICDSFRSDSRSPNRAIRTNRCRRTRVFRGTGYGTGPIIGVRGRPTRRWRIAKPRRSNPTIRRCRATAGNGRQWLEDEGQRNRDGRRRPRSDVAGCGESRSPQRTVLTTRGRWAHAIRGKGHAIRLNTSMRD